MKKYWYKRTFADGTDGGYIERTKKEVYNIRIDQEFNKSKGVQPMYSLQQASSFYHLWRFCLNHKTAIWSLFVGLLCVILGFILAK